MQWLVYKLQLIHRKSTNFYTRVSTVFGYNILMFLMYKHRVKL